MAGGARRFQYCEVSSSSSSYCYNRTPRVNVRHILTEHRVSPYIHMLSFFTCVDLNNGLAPFPVVALIPKPPSAMRVVYMEIGASSPSFPSYLPSRARGMEMPISERKSASREAGGMGSVGLGRGGWSGREAGAAERGRGKDSGKGERQGQRKEVEAGTAKVAAKAEGDGDRGQAVTHLPFAFS